VIEKLVEYFFNIGKSDNAAYAEHDLIGGSIKVNLGEFQDPLPSVNPYNLEEIQIAILKAVLVHEDLHYALAECSDTLGSQEHDTVYDWIYEWLNGE